MRSWWNAHYYETKIFNECFCPFILDSLGSLLNILFINKLILT